MWRPGEKSEGHTSKVAHEIVEYMRGRVFDLGCGERKIFPARNITGIDNGREAKLFNNKIRCDTIGDISKLDWVADHSIDTAFSSHVLEHFEDYKAVLAEWWRILKVGGYLVMYLPHKHFYPCRGMPWANPDHKQDFLPEDITLAMREVAWRSGRGWEQVRNETRGGGDEYSFLQVYKKLDTVTCKEYVEPQKPKKSLGIVRLGAYGDALWISTILPHFREEFDHITLYTQRQGEAALRHDPNIDRIVSVPQHLFGWDDEENAKMGFATIGELMAGFVRKLEGNHDRLLNLIGTVEGSLLPHRTHPNYWLPQQTRRAVMGGQNYMETIHVASRVPYDPKAARVRFYAAEDEVQWATAERAKHAGPFVVISPTGSSLPKHWPFAQKAMDMFSEQGVSGVLLGDLRGVKYTAPAGWQVVGMDWDIRKAFTLAAMADVVIGTESAVVNSVAHGSPLKVVLLSHSTATNLTRDWTRTIAVEAAGLNCYPCHRIHPDWQHCSVSKETGAAACQSSMTAEVIVDYVMQWLHGELVDADLQQDVLAEVE